MRYLITVSSLTPGSGLSRYVFSLCRLLTESGNDVWIMTTHDNGTINFERKELDTISESIKLISLGLKNKLIKYIEALRFIHNINPDFIINNYNAVIQFLLPLVPRRIKMIHVLHSDTDDFYRIAAINGKRIAGWIAPTISIANHFNKYSANRYSDKVIVIPHGVEEVGMNEKNNDKLEIIYAGVLYEHKGVKILPNIIKRLVDQGVNLHFTIIGGGILDQWLREKFVNEIAKGIVTMTGVIPHDQVYATMAKADIFLYPTHLDAFGLVIAEAMMNGLVPVVTHLPGITDNLITHGEDGYLISQDDFNTFVTRIDELNNNRDLLRAIQNKAYRKSVEKLSIRIMQQNYLRYFNSL